jgi:predicted DNA-binding transcriptional regulator YafY
MFKGAGLRRKLSMTDNINPSGASRPDRDRRLRQADRLGRILSVLRLIQGRGKWNAKAIASELEVTERTVYRDLQALEFAGVPWSYDAEEQSYRVRSDYRFPVPNLTDDEVIGQAVATAITRAAGLDVAGTAAPMTQKLAAASDDDTKQLLADAEQVVCVLGLQLADHSKHQDTIQAVQQALIQKRRTTHGCRRPNGTAFESSCPTLKGGGSRGRKRSIFPTATSRSVST